MLSVQRRRLLWNILIWGCLSLSSCDALKPRVNPDETKAKKQLWDIFKGIELARHATHQPPPAQMKEFVHWLKAGGAVEIEGISYDAGTIRDRWNTEIVLIARGEELVGLASCGRNRAWDAGTGDDIVLRIDEARASWSNNDDDAGDTE